MSEEVPPCFCCGDPADVETQAGPGKYAGKFLCNACYAELAFGILPNVSARYGPGHAATKEDTSPAWENAVRAVEGD